MIKKIFIIRDSKSEAYNNPFFSLTHGEAERSFAQLAKDPQSMVFQFPEDFDLFFVGQYDDQTGKFETLATPQHVCKAIDVRKQ